MIWRVVQSLLAVCGALLCAAAVAEPAPAADGIVGDWMVASQDAIIRFARDGDGYDGRIVWQLHDKYGPEDGPELDGKPIVDRHNSDPSQRSRPVDGLRMIWGLHYDADEQEWDGGRVYDIEDGHTYSCNVHLADAEHLRLRGYFGITLLGGTTTWTRVRMLPSAGQNPAGTPTVPAVNPGKSGGGP
jgi:uncharacterized protein (DUF2147 family)